MPVVTVSLQSCATLRLQSREAMVLVLTHLKGCVSPILCRRPRWRGRHGQTQELPPGAASQAGEGVPPGWDANPKQWWGLWTRARMPGNWSVGISELGGALTCGYGGALLWVQVWECLGAVCPALSCRVRSHLWTSLLKLLKWQSDRGGCKAA